MERVKEKNNEIGYWQDKLTEEHKKNVDLETALKKCYLVERSLKCKIADLEKPHNLFIVIKKWLKKINKLR